MVTTVADFALDGVGKDVYLIKDNKIIGLAYSVVDSGFVISLEMKDYRAKELVKDSEYVKQLGFKHSYFRFEAFNGYYIGNDHEKVAALEDVQAVEKDRLHRAMCDRQLFGQVPEFGDWYGVLSQHNEKSQPLRVKFPMNATTWELVMGDKRRTTRSLTVTLIEKDEAHFVLKYPDEAEFIKDRAHWAGEVEYEKLPFQPEDVVASTAIKVKFPHTREIWDAVVVDAQEEHVVDEDSRMDYFVVEYPNQGELDKARSRWQGNIEHSVVGEEDGDWTKVAQ